MNCVQDDVQTIFNKREVHAKHLIVNWTRRQAVDGRNRIQSPMACMKTYVEIADLGSTLY